MAACFGLTSMTRPAKAAGAQVARQHGADGGRPVAGPEEGHRARPEEMIEVADGHRAAPVLTITCFQTAVEREEWRLGGDTMHKPMVWLRTLVASVVQISRIGFDPA